MKWDKAKFVKAVEECWNEMPIVQAILGEKIYTLLMERLAFKLYEESDHKTSTP